MNKRIFLCIVLLCLLFCLPLLAKMDNLCRGDWDYFIFNHEVPQVTILSYHQFPFWNPFYCGGLSSLGNPQTRFLSPSIIITSIFGVVRGLKIEIFLHFIIGMLGMFFLSDYLKIKGILRLLPGVIFLFSGPLVLHLTEGHMTWLPAVFLPFVFLFLLKSEEKTKDIIPAAIFIALMIYDGATYILYFAAVFLLSFATLSSLQKRNWLPLRNSLGILLIGLLLTAPKAFPEIEQMILFPRVDQFSQSPGLSLFDLPEIFLNQDQYMRKICELTQGAGWWEFGSYVGITVALLYALSFFLFKKQWPLLLSSLFLLLIGMGNFSPFSPWAILHPLPVFKNMQVPSRAFIIFVFTVGLLAGMITQLLSEKFSQKRKARLFSLALAILITTDLFRVSVPIFIEALRPFKANRKFAVSLFNPQPLPQQPFTQIEMTDEERFRYYAWSGMFPVIDKNQGVINGYEPIPIKRAAIASGKPGYRGEYYLLKGDGQVKQTFWSPNKLVFDLNIKNEDRLVINQNYERNWKASPARPVISQDGLISVAVAPGDKKIEIFYFPLSFLWGIITMILTAILLFYAWPRLDKKTS